MEWEGKGGEYTGQIYFLLFHGLRGIFIGEGVIFWEQQTADLWAEHQPYPVHGQCIGAEEEGRENQRDI